MSIICVESPLGTWGEELIGRGISVYSADRKEGFDIKLIKSLKKLIRRGDFDIIHCHQYTPWVYGTLATLGTKSKVIFTEHGRFYPDKSSWKRRVINPLLSFFTDAFTAISESTKASLVTYEFLNERNIDVIYNGIKPLTSKNLETQTKLAYSIPEDTRILGTIARLDPIKNQKMMLKAFKIISDSSQNTVLIIVGDGEMRDDLTVIAEGLGISNKIIFTGYISNPIELLNIFDIFLLSSFSEGTSMTLLEAMSLSKPCVVTDAGGNSEIIINDRNGYVVKNDDAEAFAAATLNILENSDILKSMKLEAYSTFKYKFTSELMMNNYNGLYMRLLQDENS